MSEAATEFLLAELRHLEQLLLRSALAMPCPSAEALASTTPFCFDTMPFESWLQWVFIPRMRLVLQQAQSLNAPSAIAPLAEYQWRDRLEETRDLQAQLMRLDAALNQHFGLTLPESTGTGF
ncbi:YqcC family protein [Halothiobacillus sp. DCM-1]|uniref:YqcC family protein n=1 Tax=Halothiobacillus sp. DCM-1 TaxID=3112558 RepID=UPI0032471105